MLRIVNCKCSCHKPGNHSNGDCCDCHLNRPMPFTTPSTELAQSIVSLANAVKDLCALITRLESKI